MSISRVRFAEASTGALLTSRAITFTAPTKGNLLVAAWAIDKQSGGFTPPPGWNVLTNGNNLSVSLLVLWKISDGTETSVTAMWAAAHSVTTAFVEYSGVDRFFPIAATHVPAYSDSVVTSASLTAASARPGLAIAMLSVDSMQVLEAFRPQAAGWTLAEVAEHVSNVGVPPISLSERQTEGTTINSTFTWALSDQVNAILFILNEAAPLRSAEIAQAKGADTFVFDYANSDVAQTFVFDGGNWGNFMTEGYLSVADVITPDVGDDGLSLAGDYIASVTLFHLDEFSSAHVTYEGEGMTVRYTMDGETWTIIPNGAAIDLAGDPDLDFKVSFAGGIEDDPAVLTRLTVRVLKSDTITSIKGRTATFSTDLITDEGIVLRDGVIDVAISGMTIPPLVGTVEFIARFDALPEWAGVVDTDGAWVGIGTEQRLYWEGATVLVDGFGANTNIGSYTDGQFHHFVVILGEAIDRWLLIGDQQNMTVKHLALYPHVMTVDEAVALYDAQDGLTFRVDDPGTVTVTEPATPTDIYAYAWSVITS